MQGSSGGASSLLYSAAVTVRFFDAVALALFAPGFRDRRSLTAVCKVGDLEGAAPRTKIGSGSDFSLADKTTVQFFVALRGS